MSKLTTEEALRWANRAIERCTTDAGVYAALLAEMRHQHEEIGRLRADINDYATQQDEAGERLTRNGAGDPRWSEGQLRKGIARRLREITGAPS